MLAHIVAARLPSVSLIFICTIALCAGFAASAGAEDYRQDIEEYVRQPCMEAVYKIELDEAQQAAISFEQFYAYANQELASTKKGRMVAVAFDMIHGLVSDLPTELRQIFYQTGKMQCIEGVLEESVAEVMDEKDSPQERDFNLQNEETYKHEVRQHAIEPCKDALIFQKTAFKTSPTR